MFKSYSPMTQHISAGGACQRTLPQLEKATWQSLVRKQRESSSETKFGVELDCEKLWRRRLSGAPSTGPRTNFESLVVWTSAESGVRTAALHLARAHEFQGCFHSTRNRRLRLVRVSWLSSCPRLHTERSRLAQRVQTNLAAGPHIQVANLFLFFVLFFIYFFVFRVSWQVQYFVDLAKHISWQVQDFVGLGVQSLWQAQDFLWALKCRFRGRCSTLWPWSADFVAGAGLCGP